MAFKFSTGSTQGGGKILDERTAAEAPFLNAAFWVPGVKIAFRVLTAHKSQNGPYVSARLMGTDEAREIFGAGGEQAIGEAGFDLYDLSETLDVDGEEVVCVRVGNLKGIWKAREEALADYKSKYFAAGDVVFLTCTGITPPSKPGNSPSPDFWAIVGREEKPF